MKSAYIITMHCPLNYGAILQTYALQTYLQSLGVEAKIIDYRPHYIVYDQSLMYVGDECFKRFFLTRWAYRIVKAPTKYRRIKAFKIFAKNELRMSPTFHTYEEIRRANLDADFFFCGSDQIWNVVSGAHKDPSYFLGFVSHNKKKISYAASGNLPLSDEVVNVTFPMINKIDCISMREDSTIASIQPYIKKPIAHVCDPVFLLDSNEWRKLYKKYATFRPREKYILVYPIGNGVEATIEKAVQIATHLHLPLYKISASQRRDSRITKRFNANPYVFLALIDNAEMVVTNSFHGTSFSIIFEKQFWTCVAEGSNQRITSLLEKAGLQDHLLERNRLPDMTAYTDIKVAKYRLLPFIAQSKDFINHSI